MKKLFLTFALLLVCSLSLLFVLDNKEVAAVQVDINRSLPVVAYLPSNATWSDTGTTESVRYGYFDPVVKVFYGSKDLHNEALNTDKFYITANDGYRFVEYSLVQYDVDDTIIMSYHGGSLISDTWVNQLSTDTELTIYINYEVATDYITLDITYRTGINYNPDGTIASFSTTTDTYNVLRNQTLSQSGINLNIAEELGGEYLINYTYTYSSLNEDVITFTDLPSYKFNYSGTLVANYSATTFTVVFFNGLNQIGVERYASGQGTISPPNFNFGVGNRLQGWSTAIGSQIIDLSTYVLNQDIYLYANLIFDGSFDNNFDLEYKDCSVWDIPCHLGNTFIFFLTEMPLVSDLVNLIYPVSSLFQSFIDFFFVFEAFGWLFVIGVGVLFITFIFKMLR